MKFILILFILIAFASTSQSQSQIIFDDFAIGDSIKKYNNKINCAQVGPGNRPISNDSCISFRFLPAKQKAISVAKVDFSDAFFHLDSNRIIMSVHLIKSYLSTDSIDTREQSNADLISVRSYLEKLTRSRGKKNKSEWLKTKQYVTTETNWKTNHYKYSLTITQFEKISPQQTLRFQVSLFIERQEN